MKKRSVARAMFWPPCCECAASNEPVHFSRVNRRGQWAHEVIERGD
jgi:hypothetical protein